MKQNEPNLQRKGGTGAPWGVFSLFCVLLLFLFSAGAAPAGTAVAADDAPPTPTPSPSGDGKTPLSDGTADPNPVTLPQPVAPQGGDSTDDAPTLTIWYGSTQTFGHIGDPQRWVNVLGSVSPSNATLSFTVNGLPGTPASLTKGDDDRRLASSGDFNIEIDAATLNDGANTVVVTAKNPSNPSETDVETITLMYEAGNVWPTTYTADWSSAASVSDAAQVVDGHWTISNGKLRLNSPSDADYDRLVAIGDDGWTEYQVTVPITIHGIDDTEGFDFPSLGPGLGLILRWSGHYQEAGEHPRTGWRDLGALGWYRWKDNGGSVETGLQMIGYSVNAGGAGDEIATKSSVTLAYATEYMFKMNVMDTAQGATYRFKVWQANKTEPVDWDMVGEVTDGDAPDGGSMLLVAHHVDASFGDVTVTPLSQVRHTLGTGTNGTGGCNGTIVIDPPGQADYAFGSTVTVTAVPDPQCRFKEWGGNLMSTQPQETVFMDANKAISATFEPASAPFSDDFNACTLDETTWNSIINLGNDGTVAVDGDQLRISVPGGTAHDLWTNNKNAVRVLQDAADEDFTLVAKFDSMVTANYQLQGIVAQKDNTNLVRFDFGYDGSNVKLFAASMSSGTGTLRINKTISVSSAPLYLRVVRSGNTWTVSHSQNGNSWINDGSFSHFLDVNQVGVFAGNAGNSPPAHTAVVDYFFNMASPISPEDPLASTLTVNKIGQGNVTVSPGSYSCGDTLTLTAQPASGWAFTGWGGDASGTNLQTSLTFALGASVSATFKETFTLDVDTVGNGSVQISPQKAVYVDGETVQLTALPASGWRFAGWTGGYAGLNPQATIAVTSDLAITATFVESNKLYLPVVIRP